MYLHGEPNETLPKTDFSTDNFRAVAAVGKTLNGIAAKRILRMAEMNTRDELFLQEASARRIEALKTVAQIETLIYAAKSNIEARRTRTGQQTRSKENMTTTKYVIGIDAGVKCGIAIYNRQRKKITYRATGSFWSVYELIKEFHTPEIALIIIETPKKNFVYARNSKLSIGAVTKIAFNSGENNRESSLLVEGFESLGFEVRQVTPTAAKWSAADLKRYTGIAERSNSHERDAVRLCFGV